jgi:hypothetical protein
MEYSRRALYALGEPFGDSATRKVAGQRIIYGGGGGGQPKSTTQITELPAWARGYAKDILAKGAALTDINTNPYVQYGGQRVSDFSPLQQQSFQGAANLQYNPAGQQYTGENVGQYMNPYLQNALAPQLREAASAGLMAQNMDAARAVGQGAFGGTRGALQQSLTQKNVLQNMADINARGYSDAFNQAAGMFNTDQARRIQEAQFGAGYGMDVNKLQNQYGQQQQAQQQRGIDVAYQNFLDQQNYPYKQLGFMSDLIKNPAIGSRSQTQMYESPTSPLNTVAGLGLGAAGLSMAKGGIVGYADGGDITSYAERLSDDQLATEYRKAREKQDQERIVALAAEIQRREDIRGATMGQGIAALPTGPMPQMADGGIVAFARGGEAEDDPLFLTELFKQLDPYRPPEPPFETPQPRYEGINYKERPPLPKTLEEIRAEGLPATLRERDAASMGGVGRNLPETLTGISTAIANRPSQTGRRYMTEKEDPEKQLREFLQKREASAKAGAKKTTPQSPPQAGLPAAAAAPQPTPQAGPSPSAKKTDTAKAEAEKGLGTTTSAKSSTKVTGGLGNVDLGYKAKSAEEIEAQIAGMSQREMAKNKGYLDAEAADVADEAKRLTESKGKEQKMILLNMAAAAFGSKAQGLDLGGIMAAGLGAHAKEREKNAAAEEALRKSKKEMRRYEQALKAGEDDKAAKFYGLAQTEAGKAFEAKKAQIDLALKREGLDVQREDLAIRRQQAGKNQSIDFYTALGGGDLQKGYALANAPKTDAQALREKQLVQNSLKGVEANFAKGPGMMLITKPAEYAAALQQAKIKWLEENGYPELANNMGLSATPGTDKILKLATPQG